METPKTTTTDATPSPLDRLAEHFEKVLMREYGPWLVGESMKRALGYRSLASLHQAIRRRTVPIPIFPLEKRKGKFALSKDAARWIAQQRLAAGITNDE